MALSITSTPTNIIQNNVSSFGLKMNTGKNDSAYYAKKGEPMYLKDMDSDEDGIISFEEFKDYCQANGISSKDMMKMLKARMEYHMNKNREKIENSKNTNSGSKTNNATVYAKEGDTKYDARMDYNNDGKVTYKEYLEYCKEHSQQKSQKSNTIIDKSSDEEFKTINTTNVINSYSETELQACEGKIECEV